MQTITAQQGNLWALPCKDGLVHKTTVCFEFLLFIGYNKLLKSLREREREAVCIQWSTFIVFEPDKIHFCCVKCDQLHHRRCRIIFSINTRGHYDHNFKCKTNNLKYSPVLKFLESQKPTYHLHTSGHFENNPTVS